MLNVENGMSGKELQRSNGKVELRLGVGKSVRLQS